MADYKTRKTCPHCKGQKYVRNRICTVCQGKGYYTPIEPPLYGYRYLDNIAPSDAAFEAYADTLERLFEQSALATFNIMAELYNVKNIEKRDIEISAEKLDMLLLKWLSELIYIKDVDMLLFSKFEVTLIEDKIYNLKGTAYGEKINTEIHKMGVDVKAVTLYMLSVKKENNIWKANVVLDL